MALTCHLVGCRWLSVETLCSWVRSTPNHWFRLHSFADTLRCWSCTILFVRVKMCSTRHNFRCCEEAKYQITYTKRFHCKPRSKFWLNSYNVMHSLFVRDGNYLLHCSIVPLMIRIVTLIAMTKKMIEKQFRRRSCTIRLTLCHLYIALTQFIIHKHHTQNK